MKNVRQSLAASTDNKVCDRETLVSNWREWFALPTRFPVKDLPAPSGEGSILLRHAHEEVDNVRPRDFADGTRPGIFANCIQFILSCVG